VQSKSWSGLQSRFERKIEAGAQFFQSQLVTDFECLDKFMQQVASLADKPILAGIFLLKSAKNAVFLNKNVPGYKFPTISFKDSPTHPIPSKKASKSPPNK